MSSPIQQGTPEWHAWRKEGIGASDAAAIMNASPYKTYLQLYHEKTAIDPPPPTPTLPHQQRGHDLEPIVREWAENKLNCDLPPKCVQHPEFPWLKASFDGLSPRGTAIEIKCPKLEHHLMACDGQIPPVYKWQLRHQMLVADLPYIYYCSYDGRSDPVMVKFEREIGQLEKLFIELQGFWRRVCQLEPPELGDRDRKPMVNRRWAETAKEYLELTRSIEGQEQRREALKKLLIKMAAGHPKVSGSGLLVTTYTRQGGVDYRKIPQLRGIDLEPYRKVGTEVTTVREADEGE